MQPAGLRMEGVVALFVLVTCSYESIKLYHL